MLDLERELDQIRTALQSGGIEFALCGGLAMAVHGSPRATIDIDLLVLEEDIAPIESAVLPLVYAFHANPMKFSGGAVGIRGISKIDDGEVLMLDMPLVTPELMDVWEGREVVSWGGRPLSVVSREGLIKLKTFRSSPQDLADIQKLQELS